MTDENILSLSDSAREKIIEIRDQEPDDEEYALLVEVTGIQVPPEGVTVTLAAATQHPDPDERGGARIPVWHVSQRIAGRPGTARLDGTAVFTREFTGTVTSGTQTVPTPTDYLHVDVTVGDGTSPARATGRTFRSHYAFLMENQVRTDLGDGVNDLLVRYYDMAPFGHKETRGNPAQVRRFADSLIR